MCLGRFKAPLVDKDHYLLELSRYVVHNPVRAALVASPAEWSWSSYLATMGKASAPEWLAVNETLLLFHAQRGPARRAYARFVAEGVGAPDPSSDCPRAGFIGDQAFVDRMVDFVDRTELSSEIPRKERPAPSLTSISARSEDRDDAIRNAYATKAYSLTEIARHFGLHVSTVSRVARSGDSKN